MNRINLAYGSACLLAALCLAAAPAGGNDRASGTASVRAKAEAEASELARYAEHRRWHLDRRATAHIQMLQTMHTSNSEWAGTDHRLHSHSSEISTVPIRAMRIAASDGADRGEAGPQQVWLFLGVSEDSGREGFLRVVNHSGRAGAVRIEGVDDAGNPAGPATLTIDAMQAIHLNSRDLEGGNAKKGLAKGLGPSEGDWRLSLSGTVDFEALSYVRTADGFVTSMHDVVPELDGIRQVVFLNPGNNYRQESRLRLVNSGAEAASVRIIGTDDAGEPSGTVTAEVLAHSARTYTAAELEDGTAPGLQGALGDGAGKWRLRVETGEAVVAMSLLATPTGHLTNLSAPPPAPGDGGIHAVPLFLSASNPLQRQSFLRVVNRSDRAGSVRIQAFDQSEFSYEPVTLSLAPGQARQFNSQDLETGNPGKGLEGSTGAGHGDWRLELTSELDIQAMAYVRTTDGFVTSMHDLAPAADGGLLHRVAFLNPGSNNRQASQLLLVNRGDQDAEATLEGIDDAGASPGVPVRLRVPAGQAVSLPSAALEAGGEGFEGAFGDGKGKWRLWVESDLPLLVASLLDTPTGHLGNLSTSPRRSAEPTDPVAEAFQFLASPTVQSQCVNCHVQGGASGDTRLVFVQDTDPDHLTTNRQAFRSMLAAVDDGADYLLDKVQGISHGGSAQAAAGTSEFDDLARFLAILEGNDTAPQSHGAVTTLSAGRLIRKPANYFDLEGKTLTFTPSESDGYSVAVDSLTWADPSAPPNALSNDYAEWGGLAIELPFSFPFAGERWTRLYVNANGNISFQRSEQMNRSHRNSWPDAGMRSIAAAVDSRSAAGLEAMIAALWAIYGDSKAFVDSDESRVVITWQAVRPSAANLYYEPLGESWFQARLYPSGVVELAYRQAPERDGIVGLFHGLARTSRTLDSFDDAVQDAPHGFLDITKVEWIDNGSTLLARMTLAEDVPEQSEDGAIHYRVFLRFGPSNCGVAVSINQAGRASSHWCGAQPTVVGFRVQEATIEMHLSKTMLHGSEHFFWNADAVWWSAGEYDQVFEDRFVELGQVDRDLDAPASTAATGSFEVFHYPVTAKRSIRETLSFIYGRVPADDEIAVAFTDFRVDDLYNQGSGTGPVNEPVRGIGSWQANPDSGANYRSANLLSSMAPAFIGGPIFAETGFDHARRAYRNFAPGIWWIAHEAVHRWAAHLSFLNPQSGNIESLLDDGCRCHWSPYLHAPALHPVRSEYANVPYTESSVMGYDVWQDNGDGTFTRTSDSHPLATGLSALDLYVMGMISASEVPDTFILRDVQDTGDWRTVRATKVPVRISDIVAAMGARQPSAAESQKEFRLGVYLLHEPGRPVREDMLERAQGISEAISEYFDHATAGRMRVVP